MLLWERLGCRLMRQSPAGVRRSITDEVMRPFQENTFAMRHRQAGQAQITVDVGKDSSAAVGVIRET